MVKPKANTEKVALSGRVVSVQPRIHLLQSLDERHGFVEGRLTIYIPCQG